MKDNIELKPKVVFDYFAEINKVPRPSKHEEMMRTWLKDFAEKHNLGFKTDKAGNVLMTKSASKGKESLPTVVLQAHMDMVCEKTSDRDIDFMKDPIETYVDGRWLRAKGTTLGADDGMGIALALAAMTDENIKHGPMECLFTVDEETGLTGAFAIEPGFMSGKYLLNLDSEDEGEIFIGCAGGINTEALFTYSKEKTPNGFFAMKISVDKLTGGHSGDDINKKRANANKILSRFIYEEMQKYDIRLVKFDGGNLHNAIPRFAEAVILVEDKMKHEVRRDFNVYASDIENEFCETEKNITFNMESEEMPQFCIDKQTGKNLISALTAVHNGILEWSQNIEGLVETSSNLASVKMVDDNKIKIVASQRSSILSQRNAMKDMIVATFELAGAKCNASDGYPGWKPNPQSEILNIAKEEYKKLFDKEPAIKAIHAGLECGLFSEKYPGLDMISFGPTLKGVHSPDERLLIETVDLVWKHLVAILEAIK